jgi:hypothetical protein
VPRIVSSHSELHDVSVDRATDHFRAQQNQRNSPLLRLPAELRNRVYGYALGGAVWDADETRHPPHKLSFDRRIEQKHSLGLLHVSRQIFEETRLLPFQLGTFSSGLWSMSQLLNTFSSESIEAITTFETRGCCYQPRRSRMSAADSRSSRVNHFQLSDSMHSLKKVLPALQRLHVVIGCWYSFDSDQHPEILQIDRDVWRGGLLTCPFNGVKLTMDVIAFPGDPLPETVVRSWEHTVHTIRLFSM